MYKKNHYLVLCIISLFINTFSLFIFIKVVKTTINKLKSTDEVFEKLYSKLEYVGSYFDGLRVAKPTEFDLNLIMKIPCNYNQILVSHILCYKI